MAYGSKPSEETVSIGFDHRGRRTLGPAVRIKIGRASGPTPIEERGQSRRDFVQPDSRSEGVSAPTKKADWSVK